MVALAIISLVGIELAVEPTALAAGLEATRELEALVRHADFDAAEITAQKLLRSGSLSRQGVARVYLQLGIVASAKRHSAGAEAAFRRALRLDRDVPLPSSVGPHVADTFARIKAALPPSAPTAPAIELTASPATGELSVAAPARRAEDAGLPFRILVTIGDVRETRDLGDEPLRFLLPLPKTVAACATATADVLDEFGNALWPAVASTEVCRPPPVPVSTRGNPVSTTAVASPTTAAPAADVLSSERSRPPARPISRATWVAAAVTGAAAVGTTVLGLVALERRDDYDASFGNASTPDQMRHLRDVALNAEHRATAGAIVTALLATATVVLYIRGRF